MSARQSTKVDARSRTISLSLSSNSPLTAPARAAWVARWRRTFWRRNSVTCGLSRARPSDSRARPTFSAASVIFLHSPETSKWTARRTFSVMRSGLTGAVGAGRSGPARARFAGVLGGVMFTIFAPSAFGTGPAKHQTSHFQGPRHGKGADLSPRPVDPLGVT